MSAPAASFRASPWYRGALLLVAALCAAFLWRAGASALASAIPTASEDHWRYWAAWHLAFSGQDPYSGHRLEALRTAIPGLGTERIGLFTPPWVLPLVTPFAVLPYAASRLAWFLASVALVLSSAHVVWNAYGGPRRLLGLALAVAALSFPTLLVLRQGQIDPWVLLGLAGFLHFTERRRVDLLAGASLALVAVKPQLFVGLWVAGALWLVERRRWKIALGCGAAIALGTLLVMTRDPGVVRQFLEASAARPPAEWKTPTVGYHLRLAFGVERFWLQWLAPACVALGSAWYWARHRRSWTWAHALPVLLWASVLGSAYAWTYDQVVLLVPVLATTAALVQPGWTRRAALSLGALALLTVVTAVLHRRYTDELFIWLAPATLGWCRAARRATHADAPPAGSPAAAA